MVQVVERSEFEALLAELEALKRKVAAIDAGLGAVTVSQWLSLPTARKHFIGRLGKPVGRQTFKKMVDRWINNGDLVEGINYQNHNGRRMIASSFLQAPPAKLKAA